MCSVGISEKFLEMATYQDLGFVGNIQASGVKIYNYFGTIINAIANFFSGFLSINTIKILGLFVFLGILITLALKIPYRPSPETTLIEQSVKFKGLYNSRSIQIKSTSNYFQSKEIQAMKKKNLVLLNIGLLAIKNAGFYGPDLNGSFNPQALREALDIGARCFIFSIDRYESKPTEPCLLYRDAKGVIRSKNSGNIKDMMNVIADEGFSNPTVGSDPIVVILDFKNTPDLIKEKQTYLNFLQSVANQISVLDKNGAVLKSIGSLSFTNQANPTYLFVQKYEDLKRKIILLTNVDTSVYNDPDVVKLNLPRNSNLRMLTHAQVYSSSGSIIIDDPVTKKPPTGTPISAGKEMAQFWLQTPPDSIADAQRGTNGTYSIVADSEFKNESIESVTKLMTTFGVQIVPHQLWSSIEESEKFFAWWGPYTMKVRPPPVQFEVNIPVEPAKISAKLNANGGNPNPPTLNL